MRRELRESQQGFVIKKVTEKHGKAEAMESKKPPRGCV